MAALELTQHYERELSSNWETLSQQKDSRLGPTVLNTSFRGKRKYWNQLETGSMTEVTERKGDTPDGDTQGYKYWIYRRKFEFVRVWDEDDALNLGEVSLPNSDEVQSMVYASNRTKDDVIIAAFDGIRYIGENGTTSDAFDTTYQVANNYVPSGSAADSGLTVAKLLEAQRLFDVYEVEDEDRHFVAGAKQKQDLLQTTQVTSSDYAAVKALVDGKIDMFAGFKFQWSQRLTVASNVRTCFAYAKSGIKFAEIGREVHVDKLPGKRHATQLRGVYRCGAVRTENKRVIRVYCDEAV